jgi:hypothetical protein
MMLLSTGACSSADVHAGTRRLLPAAVGGAGAGPAELGRLLLSCAQVAAAGAASDAGHGGGRRLDCGSVVMSLFTNTIHFKPE